MQRKDLPSELATGLQVLNGAKVGLAIFAVFYLVWTF